MAGRAAVLRWLIALGAATQDSAPQVAPPSEELLRYLAEFGDADDRWVDPTTIAADEADASADPDDATEPEDPDDVPPDRPR